MTTEEIIAISWIYVKSLSPAILAITVIAFAEEAVWLIKKAISFDLKINKDY